MIGGWITDQWSWHWLFYLNLVPGIAVAALVPRYVHIDEPDLSLIKRGDYLGIVLMSGFSAASNTCWRKARARTGSATTRS